MQKNSPERAIIEQKVEALKILPGILADHQIRHLAVSEAMTVDTYAVGPRTTLRKVAAEMADHRYGSAVVIEKERVVGILTTVDGLRALSLILGEQHRPTA